MVEPIQHCYQVQWKKNNLQTQMHDYNVFIYHAVEQETHFVLEKLYQLVNLQCRERFFIKTMQESDKRL